MREILFRGKRIDTEQFVEGYLVNSNQDIWWIAQNRYRFGSVFNEYSCDDTFIWNRVIPETVGQFTGLYDKNGTKIFEGDIIKYYNFTYVMCFSERYAEFYVVRNNPYSSIVISDMSISSAEVLGNIYDNPELLKGE